MKLNKMIIGITGGVGSGKSSVLDFIEENYDVTIIKADLVGSELMEIGMPIYDGLINLYGKEILNPDLTINKQAVAALAFQSEESVKKINELEHPIIHEEIIRRMNKAKTRFVFVEAALLKEGKLDTLCDEIFFIYVNREERIKRLMENRHYSLEKCNQVISRQMSDEEFMSFSTITIDNSHDFSETEKSVRNEMKNLEERIRAV